MPATSQPLGRLHLEMIGFPSNEEAQVVVWSVFSGPGMSRKEFGWAPCRWIGPGTMLKFVYSFLINFISITTVY